MAIEVVDPPDVAAINSNMGCIEIMFQAFTTALSKWINSNMGCIEIEYLLVGSYGSSKINSNMGCVEI